MIDKRILSSDNDLIADEAKRYGIDVPFKRPPEISGDYISDWQVLNHALLFFLNNLDKLYHYMIKQMYFDP